MKQLSLFTRARPGLAKARRCQRTKESPRIVDGKVTRIILQCVRPEHETGGCVFDQIEHDKREKREAKRRRQLASK